LDHPQSIEETMLTLFWIIFGAFLAALAIAAGLSIHFRRRELLAASLSTVDDRAIELILRKGELFVDDEPLDLDEIDEEEQRFWSETWEEPEDW
jgi:hypothetical protein